MVPFSLCRQAIVVAALGETTYTCTDPFVEATTLVDGGARDAILAVAAAAGPQPSLYQQQQGMDRGISFLGAKFQHRMAYIGQVSLDLNAGAYPAIFQIGIASALVKTQMHVDPVTGIRLPDKLPNLFASDEQDTGEILLRWSNHLNMMIAASNSSDELYAVSTDGDLQAFQTGSPFVLLGSAASNQPNRFATRNKRFLDEEHALMLVHCLTVPVPLHRDFSIGYEVYGHLKVRGR